MRLALALNVILGLIANFAAVYAALLAFGPLNVALYSTACILAVTFWLRSCSPGA